MIQSFSIGRFVNFVAGFATKGPIFGWAILWIALIAIGLWRRDFSMEPGLSLPGIGSGLVALLPVSLLFAYLLGVIPAAITGMICYLVSRMAMPVWRWVLASAILGGVTATLGLVTIVGDVPFDHVTLIFGPLPGVVAAAICAYQARNARWALSSGKRQ